MDVSVDTIRTLATTYGLKVLGSIAIFVIGRWLAHVLINGLKNLLEKAQVDNTLISFLANVLYYVSVAIVIVMSADVLPALITSGLTVIE